MNGLLSREFLATHETDRQSIIAIHNPFHEKKEDAQMKWVGIIDAYKQLGLNGPVLLDLGCGVSSLPLYFKQLVPTVYAIDMVSPANKHLFDAAGVQFLHESADAMSFPENSIDVVTDSCAVGCSMDLEKVLPCVFKCLKPGGYFISVGDSCLTEHRVPFASPTFWRTAALRAGFEIVGGDDERPLDSCFSFQYNQYKLFISRLVLRKPVS
jgi:SAM-dependent methyltransferase